MTTQMFRSLVLTVSLMMIFGVAGRALAAPSDDRILPIDNYTSEKGRTLART